MGGGATLAGIVLAAIVVFIIERDFVKASAFALAGAVLTFFGLIHGEAIGIGSSIPVAISYARSPRCSSAARNSPNSSRRRRPRIMLTPRQRVMD